MSGVDTEPVCLNVGYSTGVVISSDNLRRLSDLVKIGMSYSKVGVVPLAPGQVAVIFC